VFIKDGMEGRQVDREHTGRQVDGRKRREEKRRESSM
jgi:hypothetical protein